MIWDYINSYGVFGNSFMDYIYFFASIIISLILAKIAFKIFKGAARRATAKTKTKLDDVLIDAIEEPIVLAIVVIGLYIAFSILKVSPTADIVIGKVLRVLIAVDVIWLFSRSAGDLIDNFIAPAVQKAQPELGTHFMYMVKKVVNIIIWLIGLLFIVSNLGYDISTLIAGLGIGGVAIALAVKDILSNMFGGVTVITDRPFKVKDRIKVAGIDGFVEELGVRSTKIRSFDGTIYIVPNSKMTDSIIENVSKEKARKVKMTIGLEYGTSNAKMKKAKQILEKIILKNKATDDKALVYFTNFGPSSLDIMVIYYIKDLKKILDTKDAINFEIKEKLEKARISMAFPTQTIHVKR
jgi:MscS family membrane protein